ncbi:hypothetical protein AB6A40_004489 [Gnathostoma spinigerum]|uniref:Uncharacterized protein n=1 Tax=Gnathostoma spinigerum TaxID=75299 RepID=A0ABD6ECN3_9BILA
MASPRSRTKTREITEKRTFVFGSSTPRDLSHLNSVPLKQRTYDYKPQPSEPRKKDDTLIHYMRKARSMTPVKPAALCTTLRLTQITFDLNDILDETSNNIF